MNNTANPNSANADANTADGNNAQNLNNAGRGRRGGRGNRGGNANNAGNANNTGISNNTGNGNNSGLGRRGRRGKNAGNMNSAVNANTTGNPPPINKVRGRNNNGGQANVKFTPRQFQLKSQPNPAIVSVQFNAGNRIPNSQNWNGPQYVVFQNYQPQWHDQNWWHQHHQNIVLIAGGWYFEDDGYWKPAWGYDDRAAYYPYDGPIRAYHHLPPDQVVANVQAALQEQGYYQGEVDGLLGPLTRKALGDFQADQGLAETEAIDDPTLDSLGMS